LTGASGAVTINPLAVTLTGSRSYDGSTSAAGAILTASNLVAGDTLSFTGSAALASKNAGSQTIASFAGLTPSNTNYTMTGASGAVTINPLAVTLAGSRIYDGTTSAAGSILTASNLVAGDTLSFTGSSTLASKNAGSQSITSFAGLTPSNTNYTMTGASGTVAISQAPLTFSAVTDSKTYDGTTTASTGVAPTLAAGTVFAGDSRTGIVQNFDSRNVGTGKTLIASGVVNDSNGGANYAVTFTTVTTGTITTRPITVTAVTDTKTYDTTISSAGVPTITGGLGTGDRSGFLQTFDTPDIGTGKTLSASGVVIDANAGANYAVTFVPVATGTINAASSGKTLLLSTEANQMIMQAGLTPLLLATQPGGLPTTGLGQTADGPSGSAGSSPGKSSGFCR
jgi:hypothetical protein